MHCERASMCCKPQCETGHTETADDFTTGTRITVTTVRSPIDLAKPCEHPAQTRFA